MKTKINFHNLVRLIKLISTTRVVDTEMSNILLNLREHLRSFEQINPGGQATRRYEADFNQSYFANLPSDIINANDLLNRFIQALSLLQALYLKLIELYEVDDNNKIKKSNQILI